MYSGGVTIYQALYRKWRPRSFDDVAGQPHITETLKNQVRLGRASHAYLFVGTRGTGKTSCAKILARAVNCESPSDGNPCNRCRSCLGIESGAILDVEELDAASNNGVDNVRALRDEAVYSPAHVKMRVYIIDEVHMLSASAFNALLKILEEPPEHLMFILATTELHKVPATILSRCQRHSFRRLDAPVIARRLELVAEEEGIALAPDAAELLARLGDGSMRDALSLLDQCACGGHISADAVLTSLGLTGKLHTAELLRGIERGDVDRVISLFDALWRDGKDVSGLLGELGGLIRDVLIMKITSGGSALLTGCYDGGTLSAFAGGFSESVLLQCASRLQAALGELRVSAQPRVTAELCLIELCAAGAAQAAGARDNKEIPDAKREAAPAAPASPPAPQEEKEPCPPPEKAEGDGEKPDSKGGQKSSPAPQDGGAGFWDELIKRVRGKVPPGNYSFLCESYHASGAIEDSALVVRVKNEFAMDMIDVPAVLNVLASEAAVMLGRDCAARALLDESGGAPSAEKLGSLLQFPNFTIV